MARSPKSRHWLERYGNAFHAWKREEQGEDVTFKRPIGLVESFFDRDGTHFGDRADLHSILNVEIRTSQTSEALRRRILLAWANLRVQHVLLRSSVHLDARTDLRNFAVRVPGTAQAALEETAGYLTFLEDLYPDVEFESFFQHGISTGRIISASRSISRLFVFPLLKTSRGTFELTFLQYAGHMVLDGLTSYNWSSHFLHLLNQDGSQLLAQLDLYSKPTSTQKLLPPAQEDLYPTVPGNLARQRWFWAIMRILRHVRKPLPTGFVNPIRHEDRPVSRFPLLAKYAKFWTTRERICLSWKLARLASHSLQQRHNG